MSSKPGGSSYNDENPLAYCLMDILGIHQDSLDSGSSKVLRALLESGITKFYAEFAVLGTDDIMSLPVPSYAGYTPTTGSRALAVLPHGDKKIGLLPGCQLCALLAYYHHACATEKQLVDVFDLTKEGFNIFRMSLYSPQDPIVPFGKVLLKSRNNDLSVWQKSVKMDPKAYKEFCDEVYWNQYKKHFGTTLDSHALGHLIDNDYVVLNTELDKAQQSWLFKVMQDSLKQPTCKAIVTKHEETKDTRAIWKEIVKDMEKSMAAQIHTAALSTYLTNTKLATQGWKGTQTNWIIHFKEQSRRYNEIANDPYTPSMLMQVMENAVSGVPNLENVLRSLRSSRITAGVKGDVSWEEYIQTLMQHSQVYDASRSRRSNLNKRVAEIHETFKLVEDHKDDGGFGNLEFNVHDVDTPIEDLNHIDVFQSDSKIPQRKDGPRLVRMSFQAWKELNAKDRLHWDKISEKGKKMILDDGHNKKNSPNRVERQSINNHDFFFNVLTDESS
jgi:hypothetical protein